MPTIDIIPTKQAGDGFMGQCTMPSGQRIYSFIPGSLLRSRAIDFPLRFWNDIRYIDGLPENGEHEVADREMTYGQFATRYAFSMDNITIIERCEAMGEEPLVRDDGTIVPSGIAMSSIASAPEFVSEAMLVNGFDRATIAHHYQVQRRPVAKSDPAPAAVVAPTPVPTDLAVPPAPAAPAPAAIDPAVLAQAIAIAMAQAMANQQS